jgi:hypothetical protein
MSEAVRLYAYRNLLNDRVAVSATQLAQRLEIRCHLPIASDGWRRLGLVSTRHRRDSGFTLLRRTAASYSRQQ